MADPATMLLIGSTAMQAVGSIQKGNAEAASYKAQAQANTYNAEINQQNADRTSREYSIKEDNLRRQQAQFLGRQRAAFSEADIGYGTGSALDVQTEDTVNSNLDALTLRYDGQTKRAAYLDQSNLDTFQSGVDQMNASSARTAGYISALGNVLGGAGRYQSPSGG